MNIRSVSGRYYEQIKSIVSSKPRNPRGIPLSQIGSLPLHVVNIIPFIKQVAVAEAPRSNDFRLPEDPSASEKKLFDHLKLEKRTKNLFKDISIKDQKVLDFIENQFKFSFKRMFQKAINYLLRESYDYYLIYGGRHDQRGIIQQEGVGLVLIYKRRGQTYLIPYDLIPSKPTKIHLESLLSQNYPPSFVTWPSEVSLDKKDWNIYQKRGKGKEVDVPLKAVRKLWPFPLPKGEAVKLAESNKSIKEKLLFYFKACQKHKIIRLEAIGNFIFSMGHGIFQGTLLYAILNLAQEFKIYALIGFLLEFMPIASTKIESQAADAADRLDARTEFIENQNKKIPLWELGARYQALRSLIRNQAKISASYIIASLANLMIFPAIFQKVWGTTTSLVSSAYFVFLYLTTQILFMGGGLLEEINVFKIFKHYEKTPELKKDFWTIRAMHKNIELVTQQLFFGAGFGAYYLANFDPSIGIGLAAAGLALQTAKFVLPLFGREEESMLNIHGSFIRFGQYLKFSPNVRLCINQNAKINFIPGTSDVEIPNPNSDLLKLVLADSNYRLRLKHSIWPFVSREKIILEPTRDEDPRITFIKYGGHLSLEEFVSFIQLNDFSILQDVGNEDRDLKKPK